MTQDQPLYLEDLTVGRRFVTGSKTVDDELIMSFARDYDPQPFHTNPAAAESTFFRGLAASGWHTTALTMGLVVRSMDVVNGLVGMGVERVSWPNPLRPGDTITVHIEVLENRPSNSKPGWGVVKVLWRTVNQHGLTVAELVPLMWVQARSGEAQ